MLLERLRAALAASDEDPAAAPLCDAVLRGQAPASPRNTVTSYAGGMRFVERARLGLGGISPGGHMMAIHLPGRTGVVAVLALLWVRPAGPWSSRGPTLVLTTPDALRVEGLTTSLAFVR